ncbi:predicted protein [Streptomyces viridochromogenes DSM 40736]|uniref:Predicted protein n=1 Tax=Streptomyces viridochromogenes (strain DSM 40736 / JCM 4977 / BCRC 1201 / Tue 494) TaxID=591159 RepID=D9X1R3_STRVT|nr:predicted protein [Streptomyces viridochromogenes DSM 40736]EFL37180.1 predicted protein [Streptomyces viridochromogenes DSM 40736]
MSRRTGLVAMAGLICAGAVAFIAVSAERDPQPPPPRVYSSCLAADTKPMPVGDDPCDGR